ncbi:MAG: hypothetical protein ACI9R3_003111 [Verrucomicrobiales bacterium]|jgi:hypothetical protein
MLVNAGQHTYLATSGSLLYSKIASASSILARLSQILSSLKFSGAENFSTGDCQRVQCVIA